MAQATYEHITSRFHNLPNAALADAIGHADALLKGAEAECKSLKDEIKRRVGAAMRRVPQASHRAPVRVLS